MATTKIEGSRQLKFNSDMSMLDTDGTTRHKITDLETPTDDFDAANKVYVDNAIFQLDSKASSRAATTAALPAATYNDIQPGATLTANANGALASQDGVSLSVSDRLLVKDQASTLENGIYTVTDLGDGSNPWILTRSTDADEDAEVTAGLFTFIEEGSTLVSTGWTLISTNPLVVGTDGLVFEQFTGAGVIIAGDALTDTDSTFDVNVDSTGGLEIVSDELRIADSFLTDRFIFNETPTPATDGTEADFTLTATPLSGLQLVALNGNVQEPGGSDDYTIAGAVITFNTVPFADDQITVHYIS